MKIKPLGLRLCSRASTAAVIGIMFGATLAASASFGAEVEEALEEEIPAPFVTGTLSLLVETHFISYGQDIWGTGNSWRDPLFHPSLELNFDLGKGFTGILGTWWDVNDNAASDIGDAIQEVDVWAGLSYTIKNWKFTLLYQEWMYASQNERIIDFKVGYAHWLNPSLTIHGRVAGAKPFDTGIATVVGVAPGKEVGPVALSFPVNVAFDTDNFHGGDSGFSFVSAGVAAGIPLKFMRGNWTLNLGATYYHTDNDVIPVNRDSDFVVGTAGITLAF